MEAKQFNFTTPNLSAVFDSESSVLIVRFAESCGNLMEIDSHEEREQIEKIIERKKPRYLLVDISACSYYTSGEHIRWYENTLFQRFKDLPVRKIAIVVPENLFVHATIEAAYTSLQNPISNVQYFRNREKAFQWLSSQSG